jgi:preprotein translocase subunit SecE
LPSRGQDVVSISEGVKKIKTFLAETRSELKKVTFPGRDEVISTTIVVIITSVIFAFYLWVADIVIIKLYEGVIRVLG